MLEPYPLLSVKTVDEGLRDPHTVIVDCRYRLTNPEEARLAYQDGHIPGAYYLDMARDLSSPQGVHGGRHPLPTPEAFGQKLVAIGVKSDTRVITYDDADGSGATRMWWLLRYFGHRQSFILDGGLREWNNQEKPLTPKVPERKDDGDFQPDPQSKMIVDYSVLRDDLSAWLLLDSRSPERYRGESEPIDSKAGHIPGALLWDYRLCQTAPGAYHADRWLRDYFNRFTAQSDRLVVYCGSGVTATVNVLALNLAGIEARLYPGSWSDWISYSDAPVATGVDSASRP